MDWNGHRSRFHIAQDEKRTADRFAEARANSVGGKQGVMWRDFFFSVVKIEKCDMLEIGEQGKLFFD